jgi:gibberellin 2-oxidase
MVVPPSTILGSEKLRAMELPVVDLSAERSEVSTLIVKACEEYGFFKVVNHGVPEEVIVRLEEQVLSFFALPVSEKQRAGPADPLGYGCKNIGFNGDTGEVEYLTLNTNPLSIAQRSKTMSNDPSKFRFLTLFLPPFVFSFQWLLAWFVCLMFLSQCFLTAIFNYYLPFI